MLLWYWSFFIALITNESLFLHFLNQIKLWAEEIKKLQKVNASRVLLVNQDQLINQRRKQHRRKVSRIRAQVAQSSIYHFPVKSIRACHGDERVVPARILSAQALQDNRPSFQGAG